MKCAVLIFSALVAAGATILTASGQADEAEKGPQAGGRTYAQNYKDMVLARCLTEAYAGSADVAKDVGSAVSALRDWTYYDMDSATVAIDGLIRDYLAKDYSNPLAESEAKGVRFDLLKCLDLYHSPALETQVKRFVEQPERTWRQDQKR